MYVLSMVDQGSEIRWVCLTVVHGRLIFGLGGISIVDIGWSLFDAVGCCWGLRMWCGGSFLIV